MNKDDLAIITKVSKGKTQEFSKLVEKYSGLCQYFFRQKFSCNAEKAQDLTQETFLRAFKKIKTGVYFNF